MSTSKIVRSFLFLLSVLFIFLVSCSTGKYNYSEHDNGVLLFNKSVDSNTRYIKISVIQDDVIRIQSGPEEAALDQNSLVIEKSAIMQANWELDEHDGLLELTTDKLKLSVQLETGAVSFMDSNGSVLLEEGIRILDPDTVSGEAIFQVRQDYVWSDDEALYGLGQHQDGHMNYRGQSVILKQENTVVAVPMLLSTSGYGILWDNYSETHFSDNVEGSFLWSKVGDGIDYYYIHGPEFDDIIANYRELTGAAPLYPKWALGFIHSRCRVPSQKELLEIAARYRKLKIPLDVIVISYRHWGKHGMGSLKFDEDFWPEPEKMIDILHNRYNLHTIISTWPSFEPKTENWKLMNEKGYLLGFQNYFKAEVYDAYIPGAGKLYWDLLGNSLFKAGVDGWWLDCSEPEYPDRYRNSNNYLGTGERYLNTYSLFATKNIYEGQRNQDDTKRVFTITRSSFLGQQKYGASTWSGDVGYGLKLEVGSDFKTLKAQVPAGLNFCMSGIPYWTTDIGGYTGGLPSNAEYREIYVRWFQYGTFCPVFRTHGERYPGCVASPRNDNITSNELWAYGKEAMEICKQFIQLRYRLMPYTYSLSWQVTSEGYTIMRGLPFDFRNDEQVYGIYDQFMYGPSILVNPVLEAGAEARDVYLPGEADWYDFWSGEVLTGEQTFEADAPFEFIPLYVRSGSIIPMGPFIDYATQSSDPLEIRVYPGANGNFILYEDESDGYNYEKGVYSTIAFNFNDAAGILTIGERNGEFPGMQSTRTFHIVFVGEEKGEGIGITKDPDRTITYNGQEISVGRQ